jgi:hypothetical protein
MICDFAAAKGIPYPFDASIEVPTTSILTAGMEHRSIVSSK